MILPELFRFFGMRFFFYSNEHRPIHVHVRNADGDADFILDPISIVENNGMKSKDLKIAEDIIEENADVINTRWKEYFGDKN